MADLIPVPPWHLDGIWNALGDWPERICDRNGGRQGPEHWLESIRRGDSALWVVMDGGIRAMVITEMVRYPLKKCLHVHACYGEGRDDWQHLIGELEEYARREGCDYVQMDARPGWERVLKDYKRTHVTLEKDLHS